MATTALAVAAYNAGPRRVDEWLRLHGDPRRGDRYDLIDWIELIPFDETRNYVQRVLEGRGMYRRRLADSQLALVHFSPVNGPLDPLPAPLLKPREEARQIMLAALLARAPIPRLKPIDGSVILLPAGFELPPLPKLKPAEGLELAAGSGDSPPPPPSANPAPPVMTPPAPAARMAGIRACVFDAYGTLFDVHSAVARLRPRLGEQADALSQLWRTKQLEYTWLRALMGRHVDFWQVTGEALDYALARTDADRAIREPLMQAYLALDAYPEVPEVLRRLRAGRLKTAILSNGEPRMLEAGASSAKIDGHARYDPLGRGRRDLQARSQGLSAGGRPARRRAGRDRLPVVQRLGRPRRGLLRPAPGLDQPPGRAP